MAQNTLKTRIKHACKTENEWSNSNPVLLLGELAFSSDKGGKYKIGDGTSTWSALSYVIPTKADIGLGNVENKSSATIRGELTKANVTKALGYTPPTTNTTYGVATSSTLGLVKSGTDITVDSSGNVSINDDSHNHIISNIDGLQSALDAKKPSEPTTFSLQTNYVGVRTANRTASQYYEFWDSVGWADIHAGSFTTHGNFIGNLSGNADSASSVPWSGITGKPSTFTPSDHTHDSRYYTESEIDTKLNTKLNTSLKGAASGLAELDSTGRVPSSQLPSYVDDVIEGYLYDSKFYKESAHTTQITGETGKIYVDLISNKTYRWSGSAFAVISETLALGETSTTAYRGDRGKIAYDHSQVAHAPSNAEVNQNAFSNVVVGSTTVAADSATDTLTLVAGSNVTITPDATNDKITIASTNTDTKVIQTAVTSSDYTNWRSLVWGASNSGTEGFTPSTVTDGVYTCNTLSVQPSTGTIKANVFKGNLSGNATTASQWATPRTLSLTGAVTGSVSIDGSGDMSLSTSVNHTHNYAGSDSAGGAATIANSLLSQGMLDTQEKIDNFITPNKLQYSLFKTNDTNNIGMVTNDGMLLSIPWSSAKYGAQIAFDDYTDGTIKIRGKSGNWGSWYTLLHSGNYTNYTVTKTGSGASGTWGINITGSAGSVEWGNITGKPSTFAPASHTHNSVNDINSSTATTFAYSKAGLGYSDYSWLAAWNGYELRAVSKSQFALASHTHSYAGSSSAGGSATSAVKLDTATAGTAARPVYFTGGKPVQIDYTIEKSVPSNAVFTDTKNTSGSTDTSSKIYLIGATSQATNPQTYSDNQVYALNGLLNGNKVSVSEKVTLEYNSDTSCLNFVFA